MLKPSPLNSKADNPAEAAAEAELNPLRDTIQRKPPQVVTISGTRAAVQTPNRAIPELLDSRQDRYIESSDLRKVTDTDPDETAVREELTRILHSKTFSRAVQMSYLFEWITTRWLAGETELLDGYHILMAVFHRTQAFQASLDSTGRVYVGRLRAQLERYYEREGAGNRVRVEIPVGKYVPVAHYHSPSNATKLAVGNSGKRTVMVLPFRLATTTGNYTGPNPLTITDHLISRLTRTRNLKVISRISASGLNVGWDARLLRDHFGAQFIVEGTVSNTVESCELTVHLSETTEGCNLWTGHYQTMMASLSDLSKRIVHDLLRKIRTLELAR